jgi:competence protein ComEA
MISRHLKALLGAGLFALAAAAHAAVDANTASAADLDAVKGLGPGTSSKILEARKSAPFKDWNDLIERVGGIGPKSAAKLSANGLTIQGKAYSADAAPAGTVSAKAGGKDKPEAKKP